jgi:cell division cycle 20, cofactor of APC complex
MNVSFTQTNQTQYLDPDGGTSLPSIVEGMRNVCALASTLLGGVATADGEVTPTTSPTVPGPTATSTASSDRLILGGPAMALYVPLALMGIVF